MHNRGSLVVVILLAAGLIAASVAVWVHRHQTRQALELWTTEGSLLIERAPEVTLYRLTPHQAQQSAASSIHIGDREYALSEARDMQGAAGFSHVRWGLCQDSSYVWTSGCDDCEEPQWNFAVRFSSGDNQGGEKNDDGKPLMLAFDTHCALVTEVDSGRCVSFAPIAADVEKVLKRKLPDE
jgi:hypothetical protein